IAAFAGGDPAILHDRPNGEVDQVVDHDQVGPVAGRDGTPVAEAVMTGGDQRGVADGDLSPDATGDQPAEHPVDVAGSSEVVGEDIVGHQAPGLVDLARGEQ